MPWLVLKNACGLNNRAYLRLLERFGSPQAVLEAPISDLYQVDGVTPKMAKAISRKTFHQRAYCELEKAERNNYSILTLHDADYPELLRHIADPPPVLYVYGKLLRHEPAVAVVGSRKATAYGMNSARKIAGGLAEHGWTIVSGLARGIDTAAHKAALKRGTRTIAILGTGLNVIYPKQNRQLFHEIPENGALVSEFFLDTEPRAHHFPVRNRIISGLCYGTVVVEASRRSGALITARLALEQGREVFAVPGSISSPASKGTHFLIRQGARLIENADQVTDELAAQIEPGVTPPSTEGKPEGRDLPATIELNSLEKEILELIGPDPVHIDAIAGRTDADPGLLAGTLLQLELKGLVLQRPGKFFQRP